MQKITLISVGRLKEDFFKSAEKEYAKRLNGFCDLKIIEVNQQQLPSNPSDGQIESALSVEADEIISKIPKGAEVVTLCIEGKLYSSEELSKTIENNAFQNCKSLKEVIIGESVYGIDAFAFLGCEGLEKVTIGSGVKEIQTGAFSQCSRLKRVKLSENIEYIGEFSFVGLKNLNEFIVEETNEYYASLNKKLYVTVNIIPHNENLDEITNYLKGIEIMILMLKKN